MATYRLDPDRPNLHGKFNRDLSPVLTIDSGDTVIYRTLDAGWSVGPPGPDGKPPKVEALNPENDGGHCLSGPVAIRGAEPEMTLEVKIDRIDLGSWGWTSSGGWSHEVHQWLGTDKVEELMYRWKIDPKALTATNAPGLTLKLRPFMGVMGMPPAEAGKHSTAPPRATGGNLDCKELIAGTSLFLPIAVPGGLFSVGDGHAVQGDGEACVTAIECPMERVDLTFILHPEMRIKAPRARTENAWIAFGLSEDLNKAALLAVEGMTDLMGEQYGLDRNTALALASLVVDLRVTQIVNGVKGVHAVLEDGKISR